MWIQKCGLWIRVLPNVDPEMWIVDQGFPKCGSRNVDCGSGFSQMWIVDQGSSQTWIQKYGLIVDQELH